MEWMFILLGVGVVVLIVFLLMATKSHDRESVPGRFDFDRYKAEELSRRGLFDHTKWR
ncbi:hypothetical protein DFW101_0642 [Solidesulfovibrio carbinoliphilus subsp. oakridgensis]|uniref:Uncharacterized protein n=2 Tax=Desulfovibrionaceae TaxID=194924 RepID=G7QE03_9BACT|nr:hypothetical protein DFW101_0642 [Solidesulfovibrio carbinoliphilus subsp. oakridgensis]